jgi:hypothetical protein
MSENSLIEIPTGLPPVPFDDDAFETTTKTGKYFPRLQFMSSNSQPCKSGDFPINHYAIVRDKNFDDVGSSVDVIVLSWRPKAMSVLDDVIEVSFDPDSDHFKELMEKSHIKDSGCMFGPEFLVYVTSANTFCTFFMGSKSMRRESPNMKALMRNTATLEAKFIETKKYSWYSPIVKTCSTPLDPPEQQEMVEAITRFNTLEDAPAEEEGVEKVETASEDRAR